jgi:hypothetical protein
MHEARSLLGLMRLMRVRQVKGRDWADAYEKTDQGAESVVNVGMRELSVFPIPGSVLGGREVISKTRAMGSISETSTTNLMKD